MESACYKRLIFSLYSLKDRILASSLFSPNTPNTIISFLPCFFCFHWGRGETNLISSALCFCSANSAKKIFSNRRPKRRGKFGPEEACQTIHEFGLGDAVNSLKQFTSLYSSPLFTAYPVQSPNFLCWTFKETSKFLKFFCFLCKTNLFLKQPFIFSLLGFLSIFLVPGIFSCLKYITLQSIRYI